MVLYVKVTHEQQSFNKNIPEFNNFYQSSLQDNQKEPQIFLFDQNPSLLVLGLCLAFGRIAKWFISLVVNAEVLKWVC